MIWSGPFAVLLDRLHAARWCFETPPATKSIGLSEKPAVLRCGEETYGGGHPFRRLFDPCLMSPQYVRPYIKVYKNDDRDDEAIAKLAMDPAKSCDAIKSEEQLDFQALHRAWERLMIEDTSLVN